MAVFGYTRVVLTWLGRWGQAVMTMLACARLGAIHSVVFGGRGTSGERPEVVLMTAWPCQLH